MSSRNNVTLAVLSRITLISYSMACPAERLVSCDATHDFAKAAQDAFYDHHPITIRPDDIWFCIAQGFAAHVNQNTEEPRSRFVAHEGKNLVVKREDFPLGQENPWPKLSRSS